MVTDTARTLAEINFRSAAFQRKVTGALGVVQTALAQSRCPYVAFSCGKDSTAVCGLVHALAPDVPLVWGDDELELPETVEYAARLQAVAGDQLTILAGWSCHASWFYPWREKPFFREPLPGTLWEVRSEEDWLRWQGKRGYDLVFLGTRASESCQRRRWLQKVGPIYGARSPVKTRCCPIWDWNEDDVWTLIRVWRLGYNPAYDRMEKAGIPLQRQRVAPLPLSPRWILEAAWPEVLERLEARYGARWE